jgi:hypothetical protein
MSVLVWASKWAWGLVLVLALVLAQESEPLLVRGLVLAWVLGLVLV